jgi:hypothetical protein
MITKRPIVFAAAILGLGLLSAPASAAPPEKSAPHFYTIDVGTEITGATDTFVASLAATGVVDSPYVIVGSYLAVDGTRHGFIAHLTSNYMLADATSMAAPAGSSMTYPTSVTSNGTSVGFYVDPGTSISYGFLRDPAGTVTAGLAAPGADMAGTATILLMGPPTYGHPPLIGTFPEQITDAGLITGFYTATNTTTSPPLPSHGFTWKAGVFSAPIDQPGAISTTLLGVTGAGMQYGDATLPVPRSDVGTTKGLTISTKHNGVSFYTNYVDTATPQRLPNNFCGWTSITGAIDSKVMVGNAGNGCSINTYAWTSRGGKFTNFVYTDPVTQTPAVESLVTGISPTGIITGGYETGWSQPPGGWLSPSNYYPVPDGDTVKLVRAEFGHWHGFIQTPN